MVRFARAHGSKSSNEREPEEATPWQDLQQQRLDSTTPTQALKVSVKEIKERMNSELTCDTEWADIEDHPPKTSKKMKKSKKSDHEAGVKSDLHKLTKKGRKELIKQGKKNSKHLSKMLKNLSIAKSNEVDLEEDFKLVTKEGKRSGSLELTDGQVFLISKRKKRNEKKILQEVKMKKYDLTTSDKANTSAVDATAGDVLTNIQKHRKKNLQKKGNLELLQDGEENDDLHVSDIANATTTLVNSDADHTLSKKQKRRKKHLQKKGTDNLNIKKPVEKKLSKRQKRNMKRLAVALDGTTTLVPNKQIHKRRKPEEMPSTIQINGQDVEVATFGGFPVRKQDADRLKELQQQMIANNIPQNEIQLAMKMERRKAEKAWAREKKNVCFQCRKSGHNLSECPELGDNTEMQYNVPASGICYKCGSTEHTHFECRVNRSQDFRFAKCFICHEQGHISNQCPDNPRGLYPKGGACKVCGDVTHLKKDCPDLKSKNEEQIVTLSTINNNLELLDEDMNLTVEEPEIKSSAKKIVKF